MTARKPCPHCAAWEARYDKMADAFAQLALARGPVAARAPGRVLPPPPDAETEVVRTMEQEAERLMVEHEAEALARAKNLPIDTARAEIARIRGVALNTRIDP